MPCHTYTHVPYTHTHTHITTKNIYYLCITYVCLDININTYSTLTRYALDIVQNRIRKSCHNIGGTHIISPLVVMLKENFPSRKYGGRNW